MNTIQGVTIFLESKNLQKTVEFYTNVFDFSIKGDYSEFSIFRLENAICRIIITKSECPKKASFGLDIKDTTSLVQKIEKYGNVEYSKSNPLDSAHPEFAIFDIDGNDISLINYNCNKF